MSVGITAETGSHFLIVFHLAFMHIGTEHMQMYP